MVPNIAGRGELRLNSLSVSACIQTVACAANGRIWIGTSEGLFGWSPGAPPDREPSAGKADVRSLLALEDNGLCVAAAEGLLVGIPGSLALVAGWDGRAVNTLGIRCLLSQILWCGTDRGLVPVVRAAGEWSVRPPLTIEDSGLAANQVTAIALSVGETSETLLWAGTPNGISRYSYHY